MGPSAGIEADEALSRVLCRVMEKLLAGAAVEFAGRRPHVATHPISRTDHPHLDDLLHK
jgi:hypothetical protein